MQKHERHLLVEPVEDVLLRDHLEPVAVHLLPQVCVLALLQLDERRHLSPKGLVTQTRQTLTETHQELLDLCLDELGAVRRTKRSFKLAHLKTSAKFTQVSSPEFCGLSFHGDGESKHTRRVPAGGVHLVPGSQRSAS